MRDCLAAVRGGSTDQRLVRLAPTPSAEILTRKPMELHLAVQRRRIDERMLGAEIDAATVLLQDVTQIIFFRAAQVLLEGDLIIVCAAERIEVLALAGPGQVDLADDRPGRA